MNEQDVRALVREAIERQLARPERSAKAEHYDRAAFDAHPPFDPRPLVGSPLIGSPLVRSAGLQAGDHPSHILLKVVAGSEADEGMCVIEPRVRCNHCGFCQSYGH